MCRFNQVRPWRIVRRTAVLFVFLFVVLPLHAQDEQQEETSVSVTDLQSYQDFPVKEGSTESHWYQITHGEQWIGWANMKTAVLQTFQEGAGQPTDLSRHQYATQVSPHLVREQLQKEFRKEIRENNEDQTLTRSELDKMVKERVQGRMKQLREVVERRSMSSTIYRNQNGTLREAKFGFSSDNEEEFTLYLKPVQLGSGRYRILVPNEVPREVTVSRERPIANHQLAGTLMARDAFESETYKFFLMLGNTENPLVRANAKRTSDEKQALQVGEETFKTYTARIILNYPDGSTREEKWWVGADGILRKIVRLPSDDEGTAVSLTYSSREEARKGYEFIFARRGRRNPFEPVWPRRQEEDTGTKQEDQCSDYEGEVVLNKAKEIVLDRTSGLDQVEDEQTRIEMERSLIQRFNRLKGEVMACGNDTQKEQVKKYEERLQGIINISALVISMAREKLKTAKVAFERRAFDRVTTLAEEISDSKGELPSDPSEDTVESFDKIVQSAQKLSERAQIRKNFLNEAPEIRGVVSTRTDRRRKMRVGISVLGNGQTAEMDVNIPELRSVAIIQPQQNDQRDLARRPGESLQIGGLGEVTVAEVHRDGVVFKYKGESIKVPLLDVEEAIGQRQ